MKKDKSKYMDELEEWLNSNKIMFTRPETDCVEIEGLGKALVEDTSAMKSIFRKDADKNVIFNSSEMPQVLERDGIGLEIFKFGDNWYYTDITGEFKLNILKYVGNHAPYTRTEEFVNLGCHTGFELLNGSGQPCDWVRKAKWMGCRSVGICDRNTMSGWYSLQKQCGDDMGYVFGYSLTFVCDKQQVEAKIYVQTQKGLRNMLRVQKAVMVDSEDHTVSMDELISRAEGNALVLGVTSALWAKENADYVKELDDAFDGLYYQVDFSEYVSDRIDTEVLQNTDAYFKSLYPDLKPVMISDAYYLDQEDYRTKIILNRVASVKKPQSSSQYFKDIDEHYGEFADIFSEDWDVDAIFAECCRNTVVIADGAKAAFEHDRNFMPRYDLTPDEREKYGNAHTMFSRLLEDGFAKLVPKGKEEQYRKQMEYEKYVIESTNNVDYLLVQYDTVNWSRKNGILVGCGRGSAAGCLLLYLLGITLVDPIKYDLIFERFLLPERAGLYPSSVTVVGGDMYSRHYMKMTMENGKTYRVDKDAMLLVTREGSEKPVEVYADELKDGDDIIFDNRDLIFTLNEIN